MSRHAFVRTVPSPRFLKQDLVSLSTVETEQVHNIELPGKDGDELRKYRKLKEVQGELNDKDEKR